MQGRNNNDDHSNNDCDSTVYIINAVPEHG
jgi:hypothetical protein